MASVLSHFFTFALFIMTSILLQVSTTATSWWTKLGFGTTPEQLTLWNMIEKDAASIRRIAELEAQITKAQASWDEQVTGLQAELDSTTNSMRRFQSSYKALERNYTIAVTTEVERLLAEHKVMICKATPSHRCTNCATKDAELRAKAAQKSRDDEQFYDQVNKNSALQRDLVKLATKLSELEETDVLYNKLKYEQMVDRMVSRLTRREKWVDELAGKLFDQECLLQKKTEKIVGLKGNLRQVEEDLKDSEEENLNQMNVIEELKGRIRELEGAA
jgi:chromosome segregation ATPase